MKRAVIAERKNEEPRSEELFAQLNELGRVYDILGKYDTSLHYYKLALNTSRKYENAEREAMSLNSIGETYCNLERYEEALSSFSQAMDVAVKNDFKDRMMLALTNMATTYRALKDFKKALGHYKRALTTAREIGNTVNIAVITSNIGTMYFFEGNFDEALVSYSEALAIDQKLDNGVSLSIDLSNMGGVYAAQGKYGEALNSFEQALKIDRNSNNDVRVAARLNRIGDIYFNLGYNDKAIEFFTRSLEINSKINNSINAAALQNSIGKVYDSMGRYEEAMDHYIKSLSLNRNIELNENILSRLGDIGMVYESRERYGEAVDYLNKAIKRDIQGEKRGRIAYNLGNLGKVMTSAKRYDQALGYFKQAGEINRELGDSGALAENLKQSGIACYNQKEYTMAIDYLSKALATLDMVKEKFSQSYFDVRSDVFRWLAAAYVASNKTDSAYEIIERFCVEKIHDGPGDDQKIHKQTAVTVENLKKNIGKDSAVVIFSNIAWDDPLVIIIDSETSAGYELDKAAVVNAVYNERGKEIERFMSQKKGDIIFNIQQQSRRDYYVIEFEKIVNYYRSLLGKKYISTDEYETLKYLGRTMYNFLFTKIEKQIAKKNKLIIQPDAPLSLVPFETLIMADGRFMVEKYEIQYACSQSLKDSIARRLYPPGRRSIMSIGGILPPAAPSRKKIESTMHFDHILEVAAKKIRAGEDVREVYGFFGVDDFVLRQSGMNMTDEMNSIAADAETYTGEQVTKHEIKKMSGNGTLADYKIIHFAGIGIVIPETPLLAALVVSSGSNEKERSRGLLTAGELASLNIQADLFHIAETKINPTGFSRGEGIGKLCGSILNAGARGVSVSLWPVDDSARRKFLKRVYEKIMKKNIPAGRAIAEAKREFIQGLGEHETAKSAIPATGRSMDYSNPYFWGSCVYYGN